MTRVVDLHPEELLYRDARGELSAADEMRLEAHLERCAACRFERQLRDDFAAELSSDVTPSSLDRIALAGSAEQRVAPTFANDAPASVATAPGAMAPVAESVTGPLPETTLTRPASALARPRRRIVRSSWLLVAAAVLAVSAAGATSAGQHAWSRLVGAPEAPAVGESAPTHVAAKRATHHRAAPAATVMASASEPATPADLLITPAAAAEPAPSPPTRALARRAVHPAGSAASIFEDATVARREGSYARAIDLQRELLARYPRSSESHVTRETMGRLLLDRGDPVGALASFDAYIADGSGALGEEAMVGRATALDRLGRTAQAVEAWRVLLAAYPETPYAAHAKSRLGSLSVR